MKQFTIISNIVLIVAVAVLFILHFTGRPGTASSSQGSGAVTAQKGDIVYIQLDTLVNQYDMYNDLKAELQSKVNAFENDLNKKGRALENDAKSFQEKMSKGLLTRSQAETINNELMNRQQELNNLAQSKQMEMGEEENVMYNNVMDAISTYVKEYNKTHGYALILTSSMVTNTVLNGDSGLNITEEILNGLNAEYIKNRNKNKK